MIILGLGSNLGDRHTNLQNAVSAIVHELLANIISSQKYETAPLLPPQPEADWVEKKFLNMVIGGDLKQKISPEALLKKIKAIEAQLGRTPSSRWAPRIIDIDILAWDDLIYKSPTLTIPHTGLLERDFALIPLADIAPDWLHPQTGIPAKEYSRQHNLKPLCN